MTSSILAIKLGALGDIFQALPYMAALSLERPTHVLTSPFFLPLFERWGRFSSILTFPRHTYRSVKGLWTIAQAVQALNVDSIVDFQNRDATKRLFITLKLQGWKGPISSCWTGLQVNDEELLSPLRTQLSYLGAVKSFNLSESALQNIPSLREVLFPKGWPKTRQQSIALVPGCSQGYEEKRWPKEFFKDLSADIIRRGFQALIIGSESERELGEYFTSTGAINLCGKTSLLDLIDLCPSLIGAIGNDTGPMHLFSNIDIPSLMTFSAVTNPLSHGSGRSFFLTRKF